MKNGDTLTTQEAADKLNTSDQTVINWWKDGTLEGYKLNPSKSNSPLRIYKTSVENLLRQRAQTKRSRARV